jgi:hypothetical protein
LHALSKVQQQSSGTETETHQAIDKAAATAATTVRRAETIFQELEERYHHKKEADCRPNEVTYASMCKIYANWACHTEAHALLQKMQREKDVQRNSTIYNAVLSAGAQYCILHPTEDHTLIIRQAFCLVKDMAQLTLQEQLKKRKNKVWPTAVTFSVLLKTIAAANVAADHKTQLVHEVVHLMKQCDVEPNEVIQRQVGGILRNNRSRTHGDGGSKTV